jgi:hypothetical protein
MRHRLPLAAGVLAGCGPTTEEAAGAVLVALPLVLLAGHLFIRLLVWLWRPLRPGLPLAATPLLCASAVAGCGAVAVAVILGERALEWAPMALWLFGTSYLTLLFVAWRIWLACEPASASSWSFFAPLSLTILPGLPLLFGVAGQYAESVLFVWIVVGYGGIVSGGILVLLLAEVLIHRYRRAAATK